MITFLASQISERLVKEFSNYIVFIFYTSYIHCKKICKFNAAKSMKFTKLVHQTVINVLCTVN